MLTVQRGRARVAGRPGLTPRWRQQAARRQSLNCEDLTVERDAGQSRSAGPPVVPVKVEAGASAAAPEPVAGRRGGQPRVFSILTAIGS